MKHLKTLEVLSLLMCLFSFSTYAQNSQSGAKFDFNTLKTFGTAGKEKTLLTSAHESELFYYNGRGCLTHMWFGGDWVGYEKTRLRFYVDGETVPSIDMEMNLGHGIGFNDSDAPWGISKIGRTGNPSGIYNTYRIPFDKSIRVTAQLGEGVTGNPPFWWIIRGTENLSVILGGVMLPNNARLKLYKLENVTEQALEEFALCDVKGNGALYQVTMSAKSQHKNNDWRDLSFLEACMRAYIGGAKDPLFLSSGLEDYFLGTYYFNKGKYYTQVAGLTHFDADKLEFSAYRFHDDDPVFFQNGLKLTCRNGEKVDNKVVGDPQVTEYTTYVWLYQW